MPDANIRFCAYPSAFIYADPKGKGIKNLAKHLFWGDTVKLEGETRDGWYEVSSRDVKGWMKKDELQTNPLLDIIFLDVGQGDSCFIVTPADERIILDAGPRDNLVRYLRWRYSQFKTAEMKAMGGDIRAFILSHPDEDHYGGLKFLFDEKILGAKMNVGTFFHNGIFPRKGDFDQALDNKNIGSVNYLTHPLRDTQELKTFLQENKLKLNEFSLLIDDIQSRSSEVKFQMLNDKSGDTEIVDNVPGLSIKILSPVLENDTGGAPLLRSFARNLGICKNGNSVVMVLRYNNVKIFFSGDINEKAEEFLLDRYRDTPDAFKADVFKAPHHGSSDFLDDFITAVDPAVSVVSSGDNEEFSHPRADTLGSLGKNGRGNRPLIFSTELGRSLRIETGGGKKSQPVPAPPGDEATKDRIVAVYGAINLRTDGHKIVMCQKKEARDSMGREWDLYRLEPKDGTGVLTYVR